MAATSQAFAPYSEGATEPTLSAPAPQPGVPAQAFEPTAAPAPQPTAAFASDPAQTPPPQVFASNPTQTPTAFTQDPGQTPQTTTAFTQTPQTSTEFTQDLSQAPQSTTAFTQDPNQAPQFNPDSQMTTPSLQSGPVPVVLPQSGYQPGATGQYPQYPYAGAQPGGVPYHEFDTMPITAPQRKPKKPVPPRDPVAMGIGNGSLLGVGYWMLGKRWLAVLGVLVAAGLIVLLATAVRELWLEIVVVAVWVAVIWHGWFLAKKQPKPEVPVAARKQRFVGLAFALPVLLVFGFLRFDAAQIESDVDAAKAAGNCEQALAATDSRWVGHRVANAPMTRRTDDTVRACDLMRQANSELNSALSGSTGALTTGMDHLRIVLTELPGHEAMAERAVNGFVEKLPTENACETAAITNLLRKTKKNGSVLDKAVAVVPKIEPLAIVQCGDDLMAASDWSIAKDRYQQLIDQYPDHELVTRAQEGVTKATQALELATVRGKLNPPFSDGRLPDYCSQPSPYSAAAPYGAARPNRALIYGTEYSARLPADWGTNDAASAVLIICAAPAELGAAQETCQYESLSLPGVISTVTFHRIIVPVRVFEVKSGKVLTDARVEIGGVSCPQFINGSESAKFVEPGDGDIHAGFNSLINP